MTQTNVDEKKETVEIVQETVAKGMEFMKERMTSIQSRVLHAWKYAKSKSNSNSSAQNQKATELSDDALKTWRELINMGFDEKLSMDAVKKYDGNMGKCIDYINCKNNNDKTKEAQKNPMDLNENKTSKEEQKQDIVSNDAHDHKQKMKQCSYCSKQGISLRCSGCNMIYYCNKKCQLSDWKHHKKICGYKMHKRTSDYEGYILPDTADYDAIPFWGVLNGTIISFYYSKNTKNVIPIYITDLSEYANVKKYPIDTGEFGISLLKEDDTGMVWNRSDIVAIDQAQLWYYFRNEQNCFGWVRSLQKVFESIKFTQKNIVPTHNTICYGWGIFKNKPMFMELQKDHCIFMYDNNLSNRKLIHKISLKQYNNIKIDTTENTWYKFGFVLEHTFNRNIKQETVFFRGNNKCFEWMSRIDYVLNELLPLRSTMKDNDIKPIIKRQRRDPLTTLLSVSRGYDEWNRQNNNQSLQSLLQQKFGVNYTDILNDFDSVIQTQINEKEKTPPTQCNDECKYASRHNLRNIESTIQRIDEDNLLSQILDKIHCYLYHSKTDIIRDNISDKFVVHTNIDDQDSKDDKQASMFKFGPTFCYYGTNTMYTNHVIAQYSWLKEELILNPYFKLNISQYYNLYEKALKYQKSDKFQSIIAIDSNHEATIERKDPITINHIMCLLLYCNETELQKIFKQHTRKLRHNESIKSVIKRQSFIAHWTRYLRECCTFYGTFLKSDECVYCGLDKHFIFNSINCIINCPLSTTTDIVVANNFATKQGIILKLTKNNNIAFKGNISDYFDMMLLSEYINEKERFFCGTMFTIKDIIIDGNSNKDKVFALALLQTILTGSILYVRSNKDLYSDKIQNILSQFLSKFMDKYAKNKKLEYFDKLIVSVIDSYIYRNDDNDQHFEKVPSLNFCELHKLNNSLMKHFIPAKKSNSNCIFSKYPNFDVSKIIIIKKMQELKLNQFQLAMLKDPLSGVTHMDIGNCVVDDIPFQFTITRAKENNEFKCTVKLDCKVKNAMCIYLLMDFVCEPINIRTIGNSIVLSKHVGFQYSLDSFPMKLLKDLNHHLKIKVNLRVIC